MNDQFLVDVIGFNNPGGMNYSLVVSGNVVLGFDNDCIEPSWKTSLVFPGQSTRQRDAPGA